MAKGAFQRVRMLQRDTLGWALHQGFNVAALDVMVSQIAARLDVACFKMDPPRRLRGQVVMRPGPVVIFECKADREDFLRDTRSEDALRARLRELNQKREEREELLRRSFPTLREGLTLFPEYDVYRFGEAGGADYSEWLAEIEDLTQQLYSRGRFARMLGWRGANLNYVVAERGVARAHELPVNWGLIERGDEGLQVVAKAVWQEVPEINRWVMATKIATAATAELCESLTSRSPRVERTGPEREKTGSAVSTPKPTRQSEGGPVDP